jgi:hypothetical protein
MAVVVELVTDLIYFSEGTKKGSVGKKCFAKDSI